MYIWLLLSDIDDYHYYTTYIYYIFYIYIYIWKEYYEVLGESDGGGRVITLNKEKNKQARTPTPTYLGAFSSINDMFGILSALIGFQCFP